MNIYWCYGCKMFQGGRGADHCASWDHHVVTLKAYCEIEGVPYAYPPAVPPAQGNAQKTGNVK